MKIDIHAQLMAQLCKSSFAQLILKVPPRFDGDAELARRLVSTIAHADKMARIAQPPASGMIFEVADKLFRSTDSDTFPTQDAAANRLIQTVSHASAMARITPDVADDIFSLARNLIDDPLPTLQVQLDQLNQRRRAFDTEVSSICHEAQIRRITARH